MLLKLLLLINIVIEKININDILNKKLEMKHDIKRLYEKLKFDINI
jgi:hypothetical protein